MCEHLSRPKSFVTGWMRYSIFQVPLLLKAEIKTKRCEIKYHLGINILMIENGELVQLI